MYERLEWKAGNTCERGLESATIDCRETGENADSRLCAYEGCLCDADRRTTFGAVMSGGKAGAFVLAGDVSGGDVVSLSMTLFAGGSPDGLAV